MKKIWRNINIKNKKIVILVIAACILAIVPAVSFIHRKKSYTMEESGYQYILKMRQNYKKGTRFTVDEDERTVSGDAILVREIPIYFDKTEKLMLPAVYALIESDGKMYKVQRFSEVVREGDFFFLTDKDSKIFLNHSFLFDGKSSYIFFQETTLTYGDHKMKLHPMASVSAYADGQYEIYDKYTDTYRRGKAEPSSMTATLDGNTTIDLFRDVWNQKGKKQLIFGNPEDLSKK